MRASGGDELVILLGGTPPEEVIRIIERINDQLRADRSAPSGLAISTGVAERPAHDARRLDDLVDAADRDMDPQRMLRRLRSMQHPVLSQGGVNR